MEVCFLQKKISLDCFGGFFAKKTTILQNSLKRKCNHDAKPSEQLNHFYLDFISQALIIYREWEVRGNHIWEYKKIMTWISLLTGTKLIIPYPLIFRSIPTRSLTCDHLQWNVVTYNHLQSGFLSLLITFTLTCLFFITDCFAL